MIIETNFEPSGFVPSLDLLPNETRQPITTVNGHSIESLAADSAFNRTSGCELDRLVNASHALRNVVKSDSVQHAKSLLKPK